MNTDTDIMIQQDEQHNVVISNDNTKVYVTTKNNNIIEVPSMETLIFSPNPYKGLAAFQEQDSVHFFGREQLTARLRDKFYHLHNMTHKQLVLRVLPIVAPSGFGKSSLVRAGLIPELARYPLLPTVHIAVVKPGRHPLDNLSFILARIATKDMNPVAKSRIYRKELNDKDGLRRLTKDILPDIDNSLLIIFVDQFEELYTLCQDSNERTLFIENLMLAAADRAATVSVIFTLRSDFIGETQCHPMLYQTVARQAVIVPMMHQEELYRAITEPANRAGHSFDENLVKTLISQTKGQEQGLSLLQFTLTCLWDGMRRGIAPEQVLQRLGGVGNSLEYEAERLYDTLSYNEKQLARRAFLKLVKLGTSACDTCCGASVNEVIHQSSNNAKIREILNYFSHHESRLITISNPPHATIEITHDVLLTQWSTLRNWITAYHENQYLKYRLYDTAQHWQEQGQPNDLLWKDNELNCLKRLEQDDITFSETEQAFIRASSNKKRTIYYIAWLGILALTVTITLSSLEMYNTKQLLYQTNQSQQRLHQQLVKIRQNEELTQQALVQAKQAEKQAQRQLQDILKQLQQAENIQKLQIDL